MPRTSTKRWPQNALGVTLVTKYLLLSESLPVEWVNFELPVKYNTNLLVCPDRGKIVIKDIDNAGSPLSAVYIEVGTRDIQNNARQSCHSDQTVVEVFSSH